MIEYKTLLNEFDKQCSEITVLLEDFTSCLKKIKDNNVQAVLLILPTLSKCIDKLGIQVNVNSLFNKINLHSLPTIHKTELLTGQKSGYIIKVDKKYFNSLSSILPILLNCTIEISKDGLIVKPIGITEERISRLVKELDMAVICIKNLARFARSKLKKGQMSRFEDYEEKEEFEKLLNASIQTFNKKIDKFLEIASNELKK